MGKATTPKSIIATAQLPTPLTTGFSAESYTYRLAFRESSNNRPGAFVGFSPRAATRTAFLMRRLSTVNGQRFAQLDQRFHCACPVIEARKFPPFEWIDAVVRLIGKGGWIILDSYC